MNMGQKVYFSGHPMLTNIPLMRFYKEGWQIFLRSQLRSYGLEGKAAFH